MAFPDGDGGDDEGGDRVGPGPAEGGVEDQPEQEDGGEAGAQQGLLGIRDGADGAEVRGGGDDDAGRERSTSLDPVRARMASMLT